MLGLRKAHNIKVECHMVNNAGTGAHLTPEELHVWTSLHDIIRILDTELENDLVANHQMTHREYEVLVRVDGAGGRARMSALARAIEASAPLVTQTVQRLEERGWISREPSLEDKRGVDAILTATGSAALGKAAQPHADIIRELLLEPMGAKLDTIGMTISPIADHLRNHRQGVSCGHDDCSFT